MGVNDWFDPVFLQKRIEILRKHNDVKDEPDSVSAGTFTIDTIFDIREWKEWGMKWKKLYSIATLDIMIKGD